MLSQIKNIVFLGFSSVCAFTVSACYMPVVDNKDVKRSQKSPPIAYKQLVTETSHTSFIKNPAPGYPKPEFISAVNKFPTTQDCLIESEKKAETPDLRLIDWKIITSRVELNLCLKRIFQSLEDWEAIKLWASFHYLNAPPLNPEQKFSRYQLADGTPVQKVSFEWRGRLPFRDAKPVPRIVTDAYRVNIQFNSSNGKPTTVLSVTSDWLRQM